MIDSPTHQDAEHPCFAVRPISKGGEAGPILCGRELGHEGAHRNMVFEWTNVFDAESANAYDPLPEEGQP